MTSWTSTTAALRLKLGGGDNGHNGLKSMTKAMGVGPHHRVRVPRPGAGRGFCAGLDLGGFGERRRTPRASAATQAGFAVQKHIAALIPHLRSLPQPVIAAVNGPAAGGGFALVLGSDIRIAARSAKFNAAFIRIGLSACDIGTSLAAAPPRRRWRGRRS